MLTVVSSRTAPALAGIVLLLLTVSRAGLAPAADHPLAPADTSSPRATLQSFTATIDAMHDDLVHSPPSPERRTRFARRLVKVASCLDLSHEAPSLIDSIGRQAAVNLKEVLDRITLPPAVDIPDAVAAESLSRWRIPNSEITFIRLTDGPRAGEWVFSADTVARAEAFFRVVENVPYRADAGSPGLHDMFVESPGWMIPEAWIHGLPAWARQRFWDVTVWQWVATAVLLAGGSSLMAASFAAARRVVGRPGMAPLLITFTAPLALAGTCLGLDELITNQIRFTGPVLVAMKTALRVGIFGGCLMLVQAALTRLGEAVIRSRRLRPNTIDTQVVRLGFRVLTVLAMAWMVILGADSIGVSVTPLIAGLGVGGLALALAAQHTVENFIAGLVLFADKPVRIGESCQFGDQLGTVEQIGLRSTRIRSLDRSLVSIPNAEFAKLRIVNHTRRDKTLLQTTLGLRYETTADQLRHLLVRLRQLLNTHPRIDAESVRVRFVGYGAFSLDVEVCALTTTHDGPTFLEIEENVLLEIMEAVRDSGCNFAFPSQLLSVAADGGGEVVRQFRRSAA